MFRSTRCLFPSLLIAVIAVGCARSSRTVHMQSVSLAPPLPGAIPVATGSGVIELTEPKGPMYYITTYGASERFGFGEPERNQRCDRGCLDRGRWHRRDSFWHIRDVFHSNEE
jgi:hypothetical protein